jgi:hypothetical protein
MPLEGYTRPGPKSDGTSSKSACRCSGPRGTANITARSAVVDAGPFAKVQADAWAIAAAGVAAGTSHLEGHPKADRIRYVLTVRLRLMLVMWRMQRNVDAVPDDWWKQELSHLPAPWIDDLKSCVMDLNLGSAWLQRFALKSHRLVSAPAPARDKAESAIALRLRALVRQQSRRGPPREESDDEDPALEGLRKLLDLGRWSAITFRRRLRADRAAGRRT